jgi:tetratricopeptide (TPR) repeat protein
LERRDVPENIPRAIKLFESASRKDTTFVQALGGLGEAYWAQYRKTRDDAWAQKAREVTEQAVARAPDNMAVRYSLGEILLGIGKLDDAARELSRVIGAQPDNDAAHSLLGGVYDKQGRKSDAIREFRAAIALRPAYWWYHWRLGTFYCNHGYLSEAGVEARRVTELQPDNARGYQLLGTVYQAQGKIDDALKSYELSLKLAPTASAYSNMGSACFDYKDFARAATFYEKAIEIDPKLPAYRRNLGDALLELDQENDARKSYSIAVDLAEDILKINPNDARTIALQALCRAKLDQGENALRTIKRAIHLDPENNYVLYKQSAILALLGRQAESLKALKEALSAGASSLDAVKDPDLRSISGSKEFKRLVSRYGRQEGRSQ